MSDCAEQAMMDKRRSLGGPKSICHEGKLAGEAGRKRLITLSAGPGDCSCGVEQELPIFARIWNLAENDFSHSSQLQKPKRWKSSWVSGAMRVAAMMRYSPSDLAKCFGA